jgi:dienelactone hydrolase
MRIVAWLVAVMVVAGAARAEEDTRTKRAKALLEALTKKDFEAAGKHFEANLAKKLGKAELAELWKQVEKGIGKLKKSGAPRAEKRGGLNAVVIPCEFDKVALDLAVTFNKDDHIVGFVLVPGKGTFTYKAPPYARPDAYREVEVKIGAGGAWPLPGTLTIPRGDGPFPAVVLVHGSGPHDRDETLGPNKPLRDIAWGLASQGIAVLRYVKRNHEHSAKMVASLATLTVKEEVIDDALAAVALVRKQKGIDPPRVYVLGHSLGAHVGPRIAAGDDRLAGAILLAGNSRALVDLLEPQFSYLFGLEGKISEENSKRLEAVRKQVAKVKGDLAADTPSKDLPLGLPASYWLDLKAYDPGKTAAKLKQPLFVLQGERDYQVTMTDFDGWKWALKGHKDATLKSYPTLNHLFMEGKGKSTPAEYMKAGHVAKEVIDDIAVWVKKH